VSAAIDRAKGAEMADRLHFEQAPLDELPYQDNVFDVGLAEIELGAAREPDVAVRELVRVTKPGGTVVLIQLTWLRALDETRREELVEELGVRPLMLVEWKQMLREAGVTDLHVEDWSDPAVSRSQPSVLGGLAELFTLRGKLRLLPRAWRRWGWRSVPAVLSGEREMRQLLKDEQVLGVTLIKGTVGADATEETSEEHGE
jgi:SAM-dependent methyltransferase